MPYITQDDRKQYDDSLDDLDLCLNEYGYIAGHVTYALYMIVARWFKKNPCYDTICQIRGVLIGTLAEFDRRIAAPYEDTKIRENGDVDTSARAQCIHLAYDCEVCELTPGTFHNEGNEDDRCACLCGGEYQTCEKCMARDRCDRPDCDGVHANLDTRGGA